MSRLSSILQKVTAVTLTVLITGTILPLHAQESYRGLIVGPAILELNADRGSSYQNSLTIENNSQNQEYNITPFVQTFTASDEEGTPTISPLPGDSPLKNWVSFLQTGYDLKTGQKAESQFITTIPQDTKPGSYYLAISYKTSPTSSTNTGSSQVVINTEVSALLFINVKGEVDRDVKFEFLKTDKQVYDPFFDGILLNYRIHVDGTFYKPVGNLFVGATDNADNQVNLNTNQKIILPGTARTFNIVNKPSTFWGFITSDPSSTQIKGDVNEITDLKKPIIGNQKFTAKVIYTNKQGNLETKSTDLEVFFFPWKTLILLILVSAIAIGAYLGIKKYTKKTK